MTDTPQPGKTCFLMLHDYGMGGLWWWVWARSVEHILETCAKVEVVTDAERLQKARSWNLEEFDLDALPPNSPLAGLRDQRAQHRDHPDFARLSGRERVYLRMPSQEEGSVYFLELGSDGRWLRLVEHTSDGATISRDSRDWPMNPPFDLRDPQLATFEIDHTTFTTAWSNAQPDTEQS